MHPGRQPYVFASCAMHVSTRRVRMAVNGVRRAHDNARVMTLLLMECSVYRVGEIAAQGTFDVCLLCGT